MELQPETATEELARLLDAAEARRLRQLSFDELRRLARLYRGESARLARLRARGGDPDEIGRRNALCVRAHGLLYSARGRGRPGRAPWRSVGDELAAGRPYVRIAWLLMGIGALVGFSLVRLDPAALYALMPTGLGYDAAQIDALYRSSAARDLFFEREATAPAQNALFGSALFSHNTRVGLLAFASGALAGVPTLLLQFYNGIMVGSISAIFLHGEQALLYLAWILPHAVPELTAITLCAAAGLTLGHAVAAPGRRRRSEALRRAGTTALALFGASVPLFFAAAWIESFVRESALDTTPRLAVAAAAALVLIGTSLLLRRPSPRASDAADWLDGMLEPPPASPEATQAPR